MKHFALRIVNDDNYDKIVELSVKEERSINNLINVLLKEALTNRDEI